MEGVEVAKAGSLARGASTSGIIRERAFDAEGAIFAKSIVAGGTVSEWHHHARRTLFGYVVSGRLQLEFSDGLVEVSEGDFFRVKPGRVHRDVNPDPTVSAVIVNLLVGEGEPVVNVPGPA